jgi:sugar phosphate isomerase/epimerase
MPATAISRGARSRICAARKIPIGYASRLSHGVIGKGLNDYDAIFSTLNAVGFNSWISIEDGVNGMEDLRESVRFLKTKIDQHFTA